jgi:hypothetical protein
MKPTVVKPVVKPVITKPVITKPTQMNQEQKTYFDSYTKALQSGTNDPNGWARYKAISERYKVDQAHLGKAHYQDLSVKALSGDVNAQKYLKGMGYNQMTGENLWKGYDPNKIGGDAARKSYREYNPLTEYTKKYDMEDYEKYNTMIENDEAMSAQELQAYKSNAAKWNLEDLTDPLAMQQRQAKKDEETYLKDLADAQAAEQAGLVGGQRDSMGRLDTSRFKQLEGEDIALNDGMRSMDANNFQQFQQLQQQQADRGMGESGMAADSYMRATMGANQAYQGAYSESAVRRGGIESEYASSANDVQSSYLDAINSSRNNYVDKKGSTKASYTELQSGIGIAKRDYKDNQAAQVAKGQQEAQAAQAKQDEFYTTSTGILYAGGQPVMYKGKPITTVEYQKMTETQRHNVADEQNAATKNQMDYVIGQGNVQNGANKNAIDAQKNAWDYTVDTQKNAIDAQKNAWDYDVDKEGNAIDAQGNVLTYEAKMDANAAKREDTIAKLTIASGKLDLDYKKLDLKDKEVSAKIQNAVDALAITSQNANTKEVAAKANAIGKELASVDKQIAAYVKSGNPVPKAVKDKLEKLHGQMQALVASENSAMGKSNSTGLGSLSAKYESGSQGGGAVANNAGDQGGASYGKYQLTKNSGHAQAFAYSYGGKLKGKTPGTKAFDAAWKAEFAANPTKFTDAQHDYIQDKHYKPAVSAAQKATGINFAGQPKAVQDMLWSIGVQHGAGGTGSIFRNAGIKKSDSSETIIRKVYAERMKVDKYFSSSPQK